MDNSFQNIQSGRMNTPFSARARQSSGSSTFSSRKSTQGGFKKPTAASSRYSISGRSIQSNQIIARSENNVVQSFGLPLPITVNEALTFTDRNASVSVNCSSNGWAWAVCGRKLLVWQYKDGKVSPKFDANVSRTPQRRPIMSQCRELTLPHCDIGHKASLITVFTTDGQQMASCLSISPTGDVRYWPSIAHDGLSIDEGGVLEGQEFEELISIASVGYVLVTTTCNLVLLQLQLINGRHNIIHKAVRPPTGFLGGISKRLSIFIGSNSQDRENRLIKICAELSESSDWYVSVLSDKFIQRWSIELNCNETFLFEDHDIMRKIKETFHNHVWPSRDVNEIEIFLLDMQPANGDLIVLAAAINLSHTPQIFFALITLTEQLAAFTIKSFCQMKNNAFYSGDANDENLKYRFITNRSVAYVYGGRTIFEVILNDIVQSGVENTEKIEFPSPSDTILAAAVYNQIPIFFSRYQGLVSISSSDLDNNDYFNNSIASEAADSPTLSQTNQINETIANLTIYDINPEDVYNTNDIISQIKAAFIYHLKKNSAKCSAILAQLFTDDDAVTVNEFDNIIVKIAKDLAEDLPAADPRWEERIVANKYALGSSSSMQIIQQLKEKNRAFSHFIDFLHATNLWDKLDTITDRSQIKSTCHLLSDINEKIVAAIALKGIHNAHSALIDEAIDTVLRKRNEMPMGTLTAQDLFYVRIIKIHEIFKIFANMGDEYLQREQSTSRVSQMLLDIGTILLTMLREVIKFRALKSSLYTLPANKLHKFEYLPWTAASSPSGIRDTLLHIINVTLKHGVRSTGEPELRQHHYKNLVEMVDFVLDGRKAYLESIKDNDKYDALLRKFELERSDLIFNFVDDGQYELAAKLAEKYLDFKTLVVICDQTKNQSRLDEYIKRYREQDFSQFAINWHLQQNKRGDLFDRFKHNQSDLTRFLGNHPSLAWVQAVFNGDLSKASRILLTLAQNETDLVARKKTMLSLAKLASLAADGEDLSNQIDVVNSELSLIDYQEQVSPLLLSIFGYDADNTKVLRPEEIINLFIAEENKDATEYDYQKALALIPHVDDPIDVKHKIWCSAVLRDKWDSYNVNAPHETLEQLMFFKLVDLCSFMDLELDEFLPPMEEILEAPELGPLASNKSFQFLLKLGYEHIFESYNRK